MGISPLEVRNVIIWGNHSSTQFPDVRHATAVIQTGKVPVTEALKDDNWIKNEFIEVKLSNLSCLHVSFLNAASVLQTVQKRGAAVIKARKLSSAMSAAKAICDHLRDWFFGTKEVQFCLHTLGVMDTNATNFLYCLG